MMILDGRTKQLNVFCRVTGFTSDFLSFVAVELIHFFHGAIQLKRCVDKLSKSTYPSLVHITVFVISGLQSVTY